ncbi:N(4)-(beta-N-acetylglucosaminyl)-L-asparaginase [Companilactobacillus alimentarius]|uniref:N(4)-(Beta-N-acetylglucosaminyl)-L-asparaginase n=1 Tax=Companilactobacillus alimentarius DSM 20249 TaxID=1423720 RepID=A0A2K9HER2_9LACO|nr:N(4)-(beta-N-acetylglucosaminyl)-L-asparaginase [Companilactobacillus alimentarius]AUI71051.1 N(4)-(beta-N-acetylglucosaminyl)-L-asparaginase [Companilactobacillus alimentarius DSM 20249]KRK75167.1 asnA2 protein [Companilactobacillus alimentarius DSM 20249]GEO44057.1 N(4)-(beta-N-acetylglucosaminyl)-L-asparaginase [Companilactobacillus alimentarius]
MTYAMIGTWRMAYEGLSQGLNLLKSGGSSGDTVESAIKVVEDYPFFKSVGYGGLPNEDGLVELDSAFMNGDTFGVGAVMGIRDVKNPISVSRSLSKEHFNSVLVGDGATQYAVKNGFELKNMLTSRAKKIWEKRKREIAEKNLSPYDGHDTVGMISLDQEGSMSVGTSTSGLFMKKAGRTGDSALVGDGFYVDSDIGGAAATGLGEDIMKGCLCYEIVRLMGNGISPQDACDQALYPFLRKLKKHFGKIGEFSLVALNKSGQWGVATNVEFTFAMGNDHETAAVYIAYPDENDKTRINPITQDWMDAYEKRIKAPIN